MVDALGIVNFEDSNIKVAGLSEYRSVAAISFYGRYRAIDFVLSNMVNSGIDKLTVLTKDRPRSLIEHLKGDGTQYNINTKKGSLQILYTDIKAEYEIYNHDVFLLNQYIDLLESAKEKYVVVAPSYMIYNLDFAKVIKEHAETGAEMTVVYKPVNNANKHYFGCKTVKLDGMGHVTALGENRGDAANANISLECFVLDRVKFIGLIKEAARRSPLFSLKDMLKDDIGSVNMHGYRFEDEVFCLNSLQEYFNANIELLEADKAAALFKPDWPIYTKTSDSAPAIYSKGSSVKNCVVANGCVISGSVENTIVGRGVRIRKGAVVKNCVLLPGSYVGDGVHLENVVVDKGGRVEVCKEIVCQPDHVGYVKRNDRV